MKIIISIPLIGSMEVSTLTTLNGVYLYQPVRPSQNSWDSSPVFCQLDNGQEGSQWDKYSSTGRMVGKTIINSQFSYFSSQMDELLCRSTGSLNMKSNFFSCKLSCINFQFLLQKQKHSLPCIQTENNTNKLESFMKKKNLKQNYIFSCSRSVRQ